MEFKGFEGAYIASSFCARDDSTLYNGETRFMFTKEINYMKEIIIAIIILWIVKKIFDDKANEKFNNGGVDVNKIKGDLKESVDRVFSKHGC